MLIQHGPGEVRRLRLQELFVAQQVGDLHGWHVRKVGHSHPVPDARAIRCDGLDQRSEAKVEAHDLVLGVIDDPGHLFGEQPGVDGMGDRAGARYCVVKLEMPVAIPGQGAHATAGPGAEA
ncbi:hypothetical protein WR25_15957 [Diploscapter pachys]|uniref:Uncharacterized protein n=1 Tax=Diploscapter pachys TaxID=2018661 RepID=A0A2A2KEQ9_9BILA|nr:hypothetical protein WR25_15957 [Diploscapter pachys]